MSIGFFDRLPSLKTLLTGNIKQDDFQEALRLYHFIFEPETNNTLDITSLNEQLRQKIRDAYGEDFFIDNIDLVDEAFRTQCQLGTKAFFEQVKIKYKKDMPFRLDSPIGAFLNQTTALEGYLESIDMTPEDRLRINLMVDIQLEKTKGFETETAIKTVLLRKICRKVIDKLPNTRDEDLTSESKAHPVQTSGIRNNCIYHATALSIFEQFSQSKFDPALIEQVLGDFSHAFNKRHGTKLTNYEIVKWIRDLSNNNIDPKVVQAAIAPTMREYVHQYATRIDPNHNPVCGSESHQIMSILAFTYCARIKVERTDVNSDAHAEMSSCTYLPHEDELGYIPTAELKPKHFKPQVTVQVKGNYLANHFTALCSSDCYSNYHTHQNGKWFKQQYTDLSAGTDPMIKATQRSILHWKHGADLINTQFSNSMEKTLLNLLMIISIVGIIPLILHSRETTPETGNSLNP
ncbi:hypothetical protein MMH89_03950 [Candidatus Comchoanobacter bicostacola]|uniref:Uncharacterized protein n=1 Tax=Candidatus Comchoanobacter bicostacola TaxID=2919598 RepID=A0ABY5DKN0_9GAMM|nr:hypothetical protein [Candidatus Comchoanobacter bicostacola]UTC24370.1 hypothetical protein MMH89_03950 [Candidatus Comchoanobacter bicostacola]